MRLSTLTALLFLGAFMPAYADDTKSAIFAGGCFWCMEPEFDNAEGVLSTTVGYTGGSAQTATYKQVSAGNTGHVEAIEVTYDPARISYEKLLDIFWSNIDPFDAQGQFADKGSQYITAIFYADEKQKEEAEKSKKEIGKKFPAKTVATHILPAKPFYAAEDYHQEYYKKNSGHYTAYKYGSGRVRKLEEIWGKDPK
jgi:peptide-methionine (S)-S-oxide reductase